MIWFTGGLLSGYITYGFEECVSQLIEVNRINPDMISKFN